jgi:hypothetical protein
MQRTDMRDSEEALLEGANLKGEALALASLEVGLAVLDRDRTISRRPWPFVDGLDVLRQIKADPRAQALPVS